MRKLTLVAAGAAVLLVAGTVATTATADTGGAAGPKVIGPYKHLVVIYEENHSFDNLYGEWGSVNGQPVDGLSSADQVRTTQVAQNGDAYGCLLQDDVNLASPTPLPTTCVDTAHGVAASHFTNDPFQIDDYIKPDDKTCPAPGVFAANGVLKDSPGALPGGCTRDLVHRFYQEQYQINGGLQNRYVTGSDAVGLTMGHYDTKTLPIYTFLHSKKAPNYVIADRFFQAAFGGSFLNHQWLVAARSPIDTSAGPGGANEAQHSVVDANGFPNKTYPLYPVPADSPIKDLALTQACGVSANPNVACGDYAVNTIQPTSTPHSSSTTRLPLIDDTAYPNIGDRLTGAGVSWNWYSGGWAAAEAGTPGPLFQYHHQPLNYWANYAPGLTDRAHLRDETEFLTAAKSGKLPAVSFVKPYGSENEHPGYASEHTGSDHLVDLLQTITHGPQADKTLVVVTYDEFGGSYDHVAPPKTDAWGPGTRVPALVLSAGMKHSGVSHAAYDTTSILATIEHAWGLAPLSPRDAKVADLAPAVSIGDRHVDSRPSRR
jgi:acid phosphatase